MRNTAYTVHAIKDGDSRHRSGTAVKEECRCRLIYLLPAHPYASLRGGHALETYTCGATWIPFEYREPCHYVGKAAGLIATILQDARIARHMLHFLHGDYRRDF